MSDKGINIVDYLTRDDKWYLGGGGRTVWAPGFPLFLDKLGFWDHGYFLDYKFEPFFTITLLDKGSNPLVLRKVKQSWTSAQLIYEYETKIGLKIIEIRVVTDKDMLLSKLSFFNSTNRPIFLQPVVWTSQEVTQKITIMDVKISQEIATFVKRIMPALKLPVTSNHITVTSDVVGYNIEPFDIKVQLGGSAPLLSYLINTAEDPTGERTNLPLWELTPFQEKIGSGRLPDEIRNDGLTFKNFYPQHYLFIGLHYNIEIPAKTEGSFTAWMQLDTKGSTRKKEQKISNGNALIKKTLAKQAKFFESVPYFDCSDDYITKYYWYRWYGIRLNSVFPGDVDNLRYPCVFEGPNVLWFRRLISYSVQCHTLETRWLPDPELAQGGILNFIDNQLENGVLPASIATKSVGGLNKDAIYHVDWGKAVWELYCVHPDIEFLQRIYDPLKKYLDYFKRERDRENSHLYDVINQSETGQEYMSRYMAVDSHADTWKELQPHLKGIDATVYIYNLQKYLAKIALKLKKGDEYKEFANQAQLTKKAIIERMWDPEVEMFFDVNAATMKRTGIKAAVCFYPFMTDIVGKEHLGAIYRYLLSPKEFWTPFPVSSTSLDDEYFSAEPEWRGQRRNCPWNGRVWPMINSHIAEALARTSFNFDPSLKPRVVEFIHKFIKMMFFDGDVNRPNCFEHYNPFTGAPSVYRGVDDYQHSWVVDLIIKYIAGLQPGENKVVIDPFPFPLEYFRLDKVMVKGHEFSIHFFTKDTSAGKKGFRVYVDGKLKIEAEHRERIEIKLKK